MTRRPPPFRQRDVTAAVKAVERAGHRVARVEIGPDANGAWRIIVVPARPGDDAGRGTDGPANEWDALLDDNPPAAKSALHS